MGSRFEYIFAWGQAIVAWLFLVGVLSLFIRALWCRADGFVVVCLTFLVIVADELRKCAAADLKKALNGEDDDAD